LEVLKLALQKIPNWLLIFDNVRSEEEIMSFLPPQDVNLGQHILITSTNPSWINDNHQLINLELFTDYEALSYLKKIIPGENEEQLRRLGSIAGNLPLSLVQSSNFIRRCDISVEQYLQYYREQRTKLWAAEDRPCDYSYTIAQVWLNDVQQCILDLHAQAILYCLPFLKVSHFSTELFDALGGEEVARALKLLESYSLIEYSEASKQYCCPPLLQAALYEYLCSIKQVECIKLALALAPELCDLDLIKARDAEILKDYEADPCFHERILRELNFNKTAASGMGLS
jgi:hypothetical protein